MLNKDNKYKTYFKPLFFIFASLLIEKPYPKRKSNGTPTVITKSAFFNACLRLWRKKNGSSFPRHPRAIPEVYVGIESFFKLLTNLSKYSLLCTA